MTKRKARVADVEELSDSAATVAAEEISAAQPVAEPMPADESAPLGIEAEAAGAESEELGEVPVPEAEPEGLELQGAEIPEPEAKPVAAKKPAPGPEPPLVEVVRTPAGWGRLIFVGLLSALLGACLAVLFLFMVNGTLDFQRAAVRAAQNETLRLEGELDALGGTVAGMEEQMAAIQELDSRLNHAQAGIGVLATDLQAVQEEVATMARTMDALRQEFTNLREDLDGLAGHVSALDGRMGEFEGQLAIVSQQVEALGGTIQRFDAFLSGLRELLDRAAGTSAPTATPWATPEPRPLMTVIPLPTTTPPPP